MQFFIDLTNETPIYQRRHRLSKHEWELVDEICKELHEASLIQPSSFDFVTTTIMPTKQYSIGLWIEKRICGDYRPLNLVTPQDRYPCPSLNNCLITLEIQSFSQLWIRGKPLTSLCS
jgi:hypothetical protein